MITKLNCPVCESKNISTHWAMSGYLLAKCGKCGMVWDHNHTLNVNYIYDKTYFINDNPKGGYANYFEGMRINKRTFLERLIRIEKKYGKGVLLDVGCALGDFLYEAKKRGWKNTLGIEVSEYASKYAKSRGLSVRKGTLSSNGLKKNHFDVIAYQDVIEHLKSPVDELKLAYSLLKRKGAIFLVTPDIGGLWRRFLGPLWYHYKPGEHIMYFSKNSLKVALKNAGFSDIKTKKTYHVMSIGYILNRMKYYAPYFFELLLKFAKLGRIDNLSLRVYAGEFEAWAQKD